MQTPPRDAPLFPSAFLFGVATADHQCEAYDPSFPPDVWDWWEQRGEVPQARGKATDFWNRYGEDLDLAKGLGCNAFRFSVAWSRVEPEPGRFDPKALEHYAQLAAAIRARAMTPIVTICHYTWPMHVEWAGGLVGDAFPDRYTAYVERLREYLGPYVDYWLTFNEPDDLVSSHSNVLSRRMAPGAPAWRSVLHQLEDMEALIRNLFRAHRQARHVLRGGPAGHRAMVSMNSDVRGFPILVRRALNWWLSVHSWSPVVHRLRNWIGHRLPMGRGRAGGDWTDRLGLAVTLLAEGDWYELGSLGKLPTYLCPAECADQLDYVALDFYYAVRSFWEIPRLNNSVGGNFQDAPVYAPALYEVLAYFDNLFRTKHRPRGKPIIVMENGLVDQVGAYKRHGQRPPRWATDAASYLRQHIHQVQRALADGLNVAGYLVWSITSNREWGLRFGPETDFGLYHVDLDGDPTLGRHPTRAATAYHDLIAECRSLTVEQAWKRFGTRP